MTNNQSLIGQQIASYKITSLLARGGMAEVYLADDISLGRQVVLKVMLAHLARDEAFVARFQREARTTARLNHPNIIQVYSTGFTPDGRPYLAMQYIRGGSLHEKLAGLAMRHQVLPMASALSITQQMAGALAVAHQAGIVHRDLKPSNILMHPNGMPVLTDLGIAAVESTATRLTQTGQVMGTPFYMSPEQAQGQKLDGRSDIYSLGVILYEMLAGDPPFQATSPLAVLHQHIYEPPPPLNTIRGDLPPGVVQIVEICLRKDPAQRFQNAQALAAALDKVSSTGTGTGPFAVTVIDELPTQKDVIGQPQREKQASRRLIWILPVIILLLLGCIAGIYLLRAPLGQLLAQTNPQEPKMTAIPAEGEVDEGQAGNEVSSGGESNATGDEVTAVSEELDQLLMTPSLVPVADDAGEKPPTEVPPPTVPPTLPPPTDTPEIINERPQIVFQSNRDGDFEIYIMEVNGSNQRQLTDNSADDNYPVVSPDGQRILYQSERDGDMEVYVMNLDGSDQRRLTTSPGKDRLPTWSPDGRRIAFISQRSGDNNLFTMNADGGEVRQLTFDDLFTGHPSWSVNDEIAFNSGQTAGSTWEIYVINADGSDLRRLTDNTISDWSPEWSPDGSSILYLSSISKEDEAAIYLMNRDGSDSRLLFTSADYEWGADWSPDGDKIVFTRESGDYSYIYMMNADGRDVTFVSERGSYPSWVE